MSISFFYRSLKCGFSIKKVFNTVVGEISTTHATHSFYVPEHHAGLNSILRNLYYVYRNRNREGINHITGDIHYCALALIGCKSVLTIHDLSALDGAQNVVKRALIKLLWFRIPLLIADKIVCVSKHTRDELMKITKRKDIEVIYNAIDPAFKSYPKSFNTQQPIILHIGTAWNKNLINTITALAPIKCHLVIVGEADEAIMYLLNKNEVSHNVKTNLTDSELIDEYNQCDIVSFCSLYEGFGMPIIEGNAMGRCVVTSSVAPMTEIASNAACLVNPNETDSIRRGFEKVLSEDGFRKSLIQNGMHNIKRFKVELISRSYLELYAEMQG